MKIFYCLLLLINIYISNSSLIFKIRSLEPHCLGGEFNENTVLVLKYKLFTNSRKDLSKVLPHLVIHFNNVNKQIKLNSENIFINKGKFTFNIKEAGLYEVCIQVFKYSVISDLEEELFVSFKMNTKTYDEEDDLLLNAINTKDVDSVSHKINEIKRLTKPIIDDQLNQMEIENKISLSTLSNTSYYKYITYSQLIITIIIGIFQIYNFKKFLKSQHVI